MLEFADGMECRDMEEEEEEEEEAGGTNSPSSQKKKLPEKSPVFSYNAVLASNLKNLSPRCYSCRIIPAVENIKPDQRAL